MGPNGQLLMADRKMRTNKFETATRDQMRTLMSVAVA